MRAYLPVAALAVVALSTAAHADTLRCGSALISTGASQVHVMEKCGAPNSKMEVSEPVMARRFDGTTFQVGTTTKEIWRYKRSPGSFPAVLTFEGGVLKKLEFEK